MYVEGTFDTSTFEGIWKKMNVCVIFHECTAVNLNE